MQVSLLQLAMSEQLLRAIGWTLIHSLWIGVLAAVLAGIIMLCTKRTAARFRYNLLMLVLVVFIIAIGVTFSNEFSTPIQFSEDVSQYSVTISGAATTSGNEYFDSPRASGFERMVGFLNANAGFIVLIWAIFFLFHCIKLMTGLAGIQRIRHYRTDVVPEEWRCRLNELGKSLGIRKVVSLLQSEIIKVPVAIGFFKPVILVPIGLLNNLPPEQVETILLHELAHVRRSDYLVNIIQRFTEAVFFFNPAFLWISSLLRQEREACCDDVVIANTNHKGKYLEALVSFQEYVPPGYAMAIHSKKHYLLNRVKRMITRENKKLDVMEKIVLIAGLIGITAFTVIPKEGSKGQPILKPAGNIMERMLVEAPADRKVISETAEPRKLIFKKQDPKIVTETPLIILPVDTVPPKKENEKEIPEHKEVNFQNFSSTINDDGNVKTELTDITDGNGKKYSFKKVNGKLTSLTIDGKNTPENEFENYKGMLEEIERVREEKKAKRLAMMDKRRLFQSKRLEEIKARRDNQEVQRKYMDLQRKFLSEQNKQGRTLERSNRALDSKRQELMKLIQKLRERKSGVPMLNGREIIKTDVPVNCKPSGNVALVSSKPAKLFLREFATPNKNIFKQSPPTIETRKIAALTSKLKPLAIGNKPQEKIIHKPAPLSPELIGETDMERPKDAPMKYAPGSKPLRKLQLVKPAPVEMGPSNNRVTT